MRSSRTPIVIMVTTTDSQDKQSDGGGGQKGYRNFHRVRCLAST